MWIYFFILQVSWSKQTKRGGIQDNDMSRYKVEYHGDKENKDRVQHVLSIENPTNDDLETTFMCNARNSIGEMKKLISIKGECET